VYGPVCTVVWQGSAGDRRSYADQYAICLLECLRFDCRGILQWNPVAENGFMTLVYLIANFTSTVSVKQPLELVTSHNAVSGELGKDELLIGQ
jgi:hypothetical protein